MGRDKATLPFGGTSLLERVIERAQRVVERVIVVAAPQQSLPELPRACSIVRDAAAHEGPLAGLVTGLDALGAASSEVFVSSVDAPFVEPRVVEHLFSRLPGHDAAIPRVGGRAQPLLAVYRTSVRDAASELFSAGERSLKALFPRIDATFLPAVELEAFDPELRSFVNLNTPDDYARALSLLEDE